MGHNILSVSSWLRWWLTVLFALTDLAHSTTLQVAPIRLTLTSQRPIAAMTIGNGDDQEIGVQAEVVEWLQENGKDVYRATQDVVANPLIFRIAARGQQILRIGLRVPENAKERSYRIFLQQLPFDQASSRNSHDAGATLQTLLRVGVPIFVPPMVLTHNVKWNLRRGDGAENGGSRHVLAVDNNGSEHVQLTHVTIHSEQGRELVNKTLAHYVLAGQSSVLALDFPAMESDTQLRIDAQSDARVPLPQALVRVPIVQAKPP